MIISNRSIGSKCGFGPKECVCFTSNFQYRWIRVKDQNGCGSLPESCLCLCCCYYCLPLDLCGCFYVCCIHVCAQPCSASLLVYPGKQYYSSFLVAWDRRSPWVLNSTKFVISRTKIEILWVSNTLDLVTSNIWHQSWSIPFPFSVPSPWKP